MFKFALKCIASPIHGFLAKDADQAGKMWEYCRLLTRILASCCYFYDVEQYKYHLNTAKRFFPLIEPDTLNQKIMAYLIAFAEEAQHHLEGFPPPPEQRAGERSGKRRWNNAMARTTTKIEHILSAKGIFPPV